MVGSFSLSRCRQNLKFGDFTLLFCGVRHRKTWKLDLHVSSTSIFSFFKGLAKRSQRFNATSCNIVATYPSFSTQHANVHVPQAPGMQEVNLTRMP